MKVIPLNQENLESFKNYCRTFRDELDESFISDGELSKFRVSDDNPTFLLIIGDEVKGVLSVMISDYYKRGKTARIRIFHSSTNEFVAYRLLFNEIQHIKQDFNEMYLFAKEDDMILQNILKQLNFNIERYTYVLECDEIKQTMIEVPCGFQLRPNVFNQDEEDWCNVRNDAFKGQQISDFTLELVAKYKENDDYLEGGMILLYHHKSPVGQVMITKEDDTYSYIGQLAVKKEFQKQGLGRLLLKAAMQFSFEQNFTKSVLVVNAENEKALSLYLSEGFIKTSCVICYKYFFNKFESD